VRRPRNHEAPYPASHYDAHFDFQSAIAAKPTSLFLANAICLSFSMKVILACLKSDKREGLPNFVIIISIDEVPLLT
jgi:hypothetical protein